MNLYPIPDTHYSKRNVWNYYKPTNQQTDRPTNQPTTDISYISNIVR